MSTEDRGILAGLHLNDAVACVWDDPYGPIVAVVGTLVRWEGRDKIVINRAHDDAPIEVPVDGIRSITAIDGAAMTKQEIAEAIGE